MRMAFSTPLVVRLSSRLKRATAYTRTCATVQQCSTKVRLHGAGATERLGHLLGSQAQPGDCILLHGEYGAGKTCLARGFVRAATSASTLEVPSPSFLLVHEYPATDFIVYHLDLWRLTSASSRPLVDFDDVFQHHASLIEWPDRLGELTPPARLDIFLEYGEVTPTENDDDNDDPWGFKASSDLAGRIARLQPSNDMWRARLDAMTPHLDSDTNGEYELTDFEAEAE